MGMSIVNAKHTEHIVRGAKQVNKEFVKKLMEILGGTLEIESKENEYTNKKELGRAMEELEKGLITIKTK